MTLLPNLLNINEYGQKPNLFGFTDKGLNYSRASPTLYHKLNYLARSDLTFHPVVSMLTDKKIAVYGNWYLISLLGYLVYLLLLYWMFYNVAGVTTNSVGSSPLLVILYVLVILCLLLDVACEFAEFFTISYRYFKKMESPECLEPARMKIAGRKAGRDIELYTWLDAMEKQKRFKIYFSLKSMLTSPKQLNGFFQLSKHIILEYFFDLLNILDLMGIGLTLLFFVLHFTESNSQWIVASLAYIFNTLRISKYLRLFIYTGPYLYTMFRGLLTDLPKFIIVLLVILSAFTGAYTLTFREGFNQTDLCYSLLEDSSPVNANQVFIQGIRVLFFQTEVFSRLECYLILGFYFTLLSILFVIFGVIFLQNILIAALTKTYDETLQSPQQYKLKIAVEFETKSLFFLLFGALIQPLTTILKAKVTKDYWSRYLVLGESLVCLELS